jgi:adenine/guanine phosphoribosyltransferase-like PRPP-binding protein
LSHSQGGTFLAGRQLLERVGARVVDCLCVIELSDLKGRDALAPTRVSSIFQY